jgi:hypothetical protein
MPYVSMLRSPDHHAFTGKPTDQWRGGQLYDKVAERSGFIVYRKLL